MNTPINFPIAKLLKEKGFDIPTFYYYKNEKLVEPYLENGSSTDTEFRVDLSDLKEHFNKWSKKVSAPTIAEVVCWIYSKYNIWIQVSILKDDEWHYSIRRKENNWEIEFPTKEKFSSIEKAYEKGIEIVLNTYKPTS